MKWSANAPLIVLLTACTPVHHYGVNSPYYLVPEGSSLTLEKTLELGPDQATVYLQCGRPVASSEVEEWAPHCFLELRTVSSEWRQVVPGEFEIYKVTREVSPLWVRVPTRVASIDSGGGLSQLYYRTRFYLRSASHPDVYRLNCQVDRMEAQGLSLQSHLSVADFRKTLEGIFTLTLAQRSQTATP